MFAGTFLLYGLLCVSTQAGSFEDSLEATNRGAYRSALEAVAEGSAPAQRAQARMWAYYNAGLLDLALAEAEFGLQAAPYDAWLRQQALRLSIDLHHPVAAVRHLAALEATNVNDRAGSESAAAEVAALIELEDRRAAGLALSQGTSALFLAACVALLLIVGRDGGALPSTEDTKLPERTGPVGR